MKTLTVTLTNEEADHVEATARYRGLTAAAVLHEAVSAYLREVPRRDSESQEFLQPNERPDLWFIGLFSGSEPIAYSVEEEPVTRERMARDIWEDSFGGTRAWPFPDIDNAAEDPVDDADSTR